MERELTLLLESTDLGQRPDLLGRRPRSAPPSSTSCGRHQELRAQVLEQGDSAYALPAALSRPRARSPPPTGTSSTRSRTTRPRSKWRMPWRTPSPTWAGRTRRGATPSWPARPPTRCSRDVRALSLAQTSRSMARGRRPRPPGGPAAADALAPVPHLAGHRQLDRVLDRADGGPPADPADRRRRAVRGAATCGRSGWARCPPSSSGSPGRWTTWAAGCARWSSRWWVRPVRSATAPATSPP